MGWFANPVFGKRGDYPKVMKQFVHKKSSSEGFRKSRLPTFSAEEVAYIKGTSDFLALNFYSSFLTYDAKENEGSDVIVKSFDSRTHNIQDASWPSSGTFWMRSTPWGLRKLLKWIKNKYDSPEVIITENGYPDAGGRCDLGRVAYLQDHLEAVLESIYVDKVNLTGYYVWSLMDAFEWTTGYSVAFGLYEVNFKSPERERSAKLSAETYAKIISRRGLEKEKFDHSNCAHLKHSGSSRISPLLRGVSMTLLAVMILFV